MENAIQVFSFESSNVRIMEKDGEPWFVAKDVCDILGLTNPTEALRALDDDEKMTLRNSEGHSGQRGGAQMLNIVSESGLYALIMRSNKPEARKFRKWVTSDVLPTLRKKGTYAIRPDKAKHLELAEKRLAIQQKNANARLAKIIQHMVEDPAYPITDDSKRVLVHEITILTTGRAHPEILPDTMEQLFSATEVGTPLGISNRKVQKLAVELGIRPPEGQSNEYGRWKMTKSPYSPHECPQFFFTEAGRDRIAEIAPAYREEVTI